MAVKLKSGKVARTPARFENDPQEFVENSSPLEPFSSWRRRNKPVKSQRKERKTGKFARLLSAVGLRGGSVAVTKFHLLDGDTSDFFHVVKSEYQLKVPQIPFAHERQRVINQLEIVRARAVIGPLVRPLEIQPALSLS